MTKASPHLLSEQIDRFLDDAKIRDANRGRQNVLMIAERMGEQCLELWLARWQPLLANSADPDMAFNNLERFLDRPEAVTALQELLDHQPEALETLFALLASSQFL